MNVLGVIPARFGSSRFPGKPLIDLKGKSMIQRVFEGASKSKIIQNLVVATDDKRILDHVIGFGGVAKMTNENHPSGTDRCGEVAGSHDEADVIINIQGDEPLINPEQIDQLLKAFENPKVQIATLGIKSSDLKEYNNPNRIKLVLNKNNEALYFSRSPIPSMKNASAELKRNFEFTRHIGLYAYRKSTLIELCQLDKTTIEAQESLEQLRWMYHGYPIHVVHTTIETPNIDAPTDVDAVLMHL